MKNHDYDDVLIDPKVLLLLEAFLNVDDTNFVNQTKFLGLNPKMDFQQLDLRDVDFSNCDLRGYDFSGADLRGAYGTNVKWDLGDPILERADTSDSLFTHALVQQKFFDENPDHLEVVERISGEYWANAVLQVERFLQRDKGDGSGMRIASAVFDRSRDPTVRSNILLFMKITTENSAQHKAFICDILSRYSGDVRVTLACVRALSAFYYNHHDAFNWLLKFLSHPEHSVASAAFIGLARSTRFRDGIDAISSYIVTSTNSSHRRLFVKRVVGDMGLRARQAVYDWSAERFFDFKELITPRMLRTWSLRDFADFREQNKLLDESVLATVYEERRLVSIGRVARAAGIFFRVDKGKADRPDVVEIDGKGSRAQVLQS